MSSYQPNFPFGVNIVGSPYEDDAITRLAFIECVNYQHDRIYVNQCQSQFRCRSQPEPVRLSARRLLTKGRDRQMAELLETDRMRVGELVKKSSLETVTEHNVSELSRLMNETPEIRKGKSLYRLHCSKLSQ